MLWGTQCNSLTQLCAMLQLRGAASLRGCQLHRRLWSRRLEGVCHAASSTEQQPAAPTPTPMVNHSEGLSSRQVQQLRTYLDYMLEINKSMNLTAVRDPDEAWQRHIEDSLALLPVLDKHLASSLLPRPPKAQNKEESGKHGKQAKGKSKKNKESQANGVQGAPRVHSVEPGSGDISIADPSSSVEALRVIDVGTGAGLPGMVLAVVRPEWKVTLLDTLRKRCDFLAQAALRAGISNVEVVWSRAEEAGQKPEMREAYDVAVARAVAETRVLAELCVPFVRVGGLWVAAKGPNPQVEVDAAGPAVTQVGGKLVALELVESFSVDGQRTAVVVSKTKATPPKFPRKPGTPNNQPL